MTKFFAAANTANGFQSIFPDCFSPESHRRIYILKGGPGTGKSTLMRQIGFAAEAKGYETEYYCCSSDTNSLDGIRIPALGVAILDGTMPHLTDPLYPGAVERIVDLGAAFEGAMPQKRRNEIIKLCKAKQNAYRTAYRYLSAAGDVTRERDDMLSEFFLSEKVSGVVRRLLATLKDIKKGRETRRYLSALGAHGAVTLDTLQQKASRICAVTRKHGLEFLFMRCLYEELREKGVAMTVCATPLCAEHIEAIYVEGENVLFEVMEEEHAQKAEKIINTARFAARERLAAARSQLRFSEKCARMLLDGALDALAGAGRFHALLEEIYSNFVDFSMVDRIKERMMEEIFANNM